MNIHSTCDWGNLMDFLDNSIEHNIAEAIDSNLIKELQSIPVPVEILANCYTKLKVLRKHTIQIIYHKKILQVSDLTIRGQEIFKRIVSLGERTLLKIYNLIHDGPSLAKKISGRTIDTLVTRFPRTHDVTYYLNIEDPNNIHIISKPLELNKNIVLFDIGNSYRQKMKQHSKEFFDCFGRGDEVEYKLSSGESIGISICQFTFFRWADKFKVFEFLETQYDKIVQVRQQSQKNNYQPKRKRKRKITSNTDIKKRNTFLHPPIVHTNLPKQTVFMKGKQEYVPQNSVIKRRTVHKQTLFELAHKLEKIKRKKLY